MKIKVLTLFPEIYSSLNVSIIGKALEKGVFETDIINIRDYSCDKHKKCDDYPYGGGVGMVMTPQPLHDAIVKNDPNHEFLRIYLSPKGQTLNQNLVEKLAKKDKIMLINGSYEGVDQRVIDLDVDMELSIGDYVLTSGDLASLVVINCVARYIPSVLGSSESVSDESFAKGMLEYPHYTRPQVFENLSVPDVLLSGNHAEIKRWREQKSKEITQKKRPDLLEKE
ncbi:MAG: tRNA (guanosine(37)-N1)-methyltransferase TrmD [Clostridiales bacterium]|nr:tRNA (guanosine(37)-N1)-methyltransferase TrmD [Clostridiales bacterium]